MLKTFYLIHWSLIYRTSVLLKTLNTKQLLNTTKIFSMLFMVMSMENIQHRQKNLLSLLHVEKATKQERKISYARPN